MLEKPVPLLTHTPQYPPRLIPGSLLDDRMQTRIAIYLNDLRGALEWLRFELEGIGESLRRQELRHFIGLIDEQVSTKPVHFAQQVLDAYVTAIDKSCRNSYCNGYRTRFGKVVEQDVAATMEFVYMAGECRGKLMSLYNSGEYISDEVLGEIIDSLPRWEY